MPRCSLNVRRILIWLLATAAAMFLPAGGWACSGARAQPTATSAPIPNARKKKPEADRTEASADKGLRISPFALSLLIGVMTIGLQILLKLISRQPPRNKSHGLIREDLVWWLDWVIAAVVALMVLALDRADGRGSLSTVQVLTLIFVFILGLSGIPAMVRNFGYDNAHDPPALRTGRGIVLPNLAGAVILLGTVVAGAQLAG